MSLLSINTFSGLRSYIQAEMADAERQCPYSVEFYQRALDILNNGSLMEGTSMEGATLDSAKQAVLEARSGWYAAGCAAPESSSSAAETVTADEIVASRSAGGAPPVLGASVGGGSSTLLWLALGLGIGYLFLSKKGRK